MQQFVPIEDLFKGRHFDRQIIVLCVSWYTSFKLSLRDLVIMMADRLAWYFGYYHGSRTHLGLDKQCPFPRQVSSIGRIIAIPQLGGLHHRYERVAA